MKLAENSSRMSEIECRLSKYTYLTRNNLPGYPDGVVFRFLTSANGISLLMQPSLIAPFIPTSITGTSSCGNSVQPQSTSGQQTTGILIPQIPYLLSSLPSTLLPLTSPITPSLTLITVVPPRTLIQKTRRVLKAVHAWSSPSNYVGIHAKRHKDCVEVYRDNGRKEQRQQYVERR